ncbi:MAG: hypothetical protein IJJ94_09230 [Bacteroidaceae bacterium]|nr:hypothetical protein [Bacteroidaceae bacterium]
MKKLLSLVVMAVFSCLAFAQSDREMTVKEPLTPQPQAAAQYDSSTPRMTGKKKGKPVGDDAVLLRISLPDQQVTFDEKQVFSYQYKSGEWWVYMPIKSKKIEIKHPTFYPLTYTFDNPLTDKKMVYRMTIGLPADKNTGRAYVTMTCQSAGSNAIILVKDENGKQEQYKFDDKNQWQENLPYGQYEYTIKAEGFQDNKGTFVLVGPPVNVPVHLASVMGMLTIETDDWGSEGQITVDGEVASAGEFSYPVGRHLVRCVDKSGVYSKEQYVDLTHEGATADMRLGGTITLRGPKGGRMTLNGTTYDEGVVVRNVLGSYTGSVSKSGYDSKSFTRVVNVNEAVDISQHLKRTVNNQTFFEYLFSPKAPLGVYIGTCKRFGWGISMKGSIRSIDRSGEKKSSDKNNYYEGMPSTSDYENSRSDLRYAFTTGPLFRITHWLYMSIEGGYGKYGNLYSVDNSAGGKDYYYPRYLKGFEADAMVHVRIKNFLLSGGYSMLFADETFGDFSVGIGFSF